MNTNGFNINRLARIFAILFVAYLSISLAIIVIPKIPFAGRITGIYKRYISPGPFFTASRLSKNNLFYISWKEKGAWSAPINPALDTYKNFFSGWNPALMYRSRLERSIYEEVITAWQKQTDSASVKSIESLKPYFLNRYVPSNADSVRLIFISKVTEAYKTKSDTLQIISF